MTPTPTTIPPSLALATRILWLLVTAVCAAGLVASNARLAQMHLERCDAPAAKCQFFSLTENDARLSEQAGLPIEVVFWGMLASSLIARVSLALVGSFIFWRRPNDWVAWLLSLGCMTVLTEGVIQLGWSQGVVDLAFGIGVAAFLPLPFVFPNDRLEPRRLRWLIVASWPCMLLVWSPRLANRLIPAPWLPWATAALVTVWIGLGGFSLVYRYARRSNAVERQQTKWVVAGFLAMFTTALAYRLFSALFTPWQPSGARLATLAANGVLYILGYVGMAVCIAFAILRHRPWDIDLILRRTLIYSVLSALLAFTYFGGVAVLQQLFRLFTGNTSTVAVIGSTLIIAVLCQPLRRRVQSGIDRRFFCRKYDAAQALAAFAASARDGVDLDALTNHLRSVVGETMQPATSAVWLRPPPPSATEGGRTGYNRGMVYTYNHAGRIRARC